QPWSNGADLCCNRFADLPVCDSVRAGNAVWNAAYGAGSGAASRDRGDVRRVARGSTWDGLLVESCGATGSVGGGAGAKRFATSGSRAPRRGADAVLRLQRIGTW